MELTVWYSPHPLHFPDGFLSLPVAILFWILSITITFLAIRHVSREQDDHKLPILGILAATIFAGQMLNFAVAGGTSGHLLGATLATILAGPWAAMLVMTCVVAVQSLIFQDGGLLAMGTNIFNMSVIGVLVSFLVFSIFLKISKGNRWGIYAGTVAGAWTSIEAASLAAGLQLSLSGTSPANIAIPAMAGIHALIGIGEALISLGAITFILSARPDLLTSVSPKGRDRSGLWLAGMILAVLLVILSPIASTHPDGLEWLAEQQGFLKLAQPSLYQLIPDYILPGINNKLLASIIAGLIGIFTISSVTLILYLLRRNKGK
jgi:cobalt/nickel transport system permease protein